MRAVLAAGLSLLLPACGASAEPQDFDHGGATGNPALVRAAYPEAPYGTKVGARVENFDFLGWVSPTDAKTDPEAIAALSLADFYDPHGAKGIRLLFITSTALWCTACRTEYKDMAVHVADYEKKGVRFLGALFEGGDTPPQPATPEDLKAWAEAFHVTFPFVLDPALKLGGFFHRAATPVEMVIDTRTMEIVWIETGWRSSGPLSAWAVMDGLLAP